MHLLVNRNYAEHAKELKNKIPTEPFFFLKPTSSYLQSGSPIEIPRGVIVHHEGIYEILSMVKDKACMDIKGIAYGN